MLKREKLLLINGSFWPTYPVLGDALLTLAEVASENYDVFVVLQDRVDVKQKYIESCRNHKINFRPMINLSSSKNTIFWRSFNALIFMFWVLINLLFIRPNKIYISTDPPVVVPFIVMLYSKIFKVNYVYHVQDIHPEATSLVKKINNSIFNLLKWMDMQSSKHATELITITGKMAQSLNNRLAIKREIHLIDNPSLDFLPENFKSVRNKGFVYCGNFGRFQLIPLILSAIEEYFRLGGSLEFYFAGDGVHSKEIIEFSKKHSNFHYLGVLDRLKAAELNIKYSWGLLPIDDQITEFAFPSKTSSYICSDINILAICGEKTPVAKLVSNKKLGIVVKPNIIHLVKAFSKIETGEYEDNDFSMLRKDLRPHLSIGAFVNNVYRVIDK